MIQKLICVIGVLCFWGGGACMNSDNLAIPIILVLGGGLLTLMTYNAYEL